MATVDEIKALKREQLDALAVEQGLDPAQFSKKEDLQAELIQSADDYEADDSEDDQDQDEDLDKEQNTTTSSANTLVNDADKAAAAAEKVTERKVARSSGHPSGFDAYGQPIFGKGK